MRSFYLLCLGSILSLSISAQHTVSKDVVVKVDQSKRDQETNLVYTATNNTVGKQTIILSVEGRSFERADGSLPVVKELLPGPNRLIQLTNISAFPRYGYMWIAGCVDTKPEAVTYLPPVASGKTTTIYPLQKTADWLKEKQGEKPTEPAKRVSYAFSMSVGDQVHAARRGTVIEIVENRPEPKGPNLGYFERYNYVILEHDDCTRGKYAYFAEDGIEVGLGQHVEAGDPLGTVMDGKALANDTQVRLAVYYTGVSRKGLIEKYKDRAKTYSREYVNADFHGIEELTNGVTVEAEHPEAIIIQEMRKRDIKRWKKRKGK